MRALAALRAPVDAFFLDVTVNDPDPEKRVNRLRLLNELRAAMHEVADFSKVGGIADAFKNPRPAPKWRRGAQGRRARTYEPWR